MQQLCCAPEYLMLIRMQDYETIFWKTVSKVPDTNDTIKFKMDRQEIVYTMDMFRSTLDLPVETTENLFMAPTKMKFIQPFMQIVGYQGVVDKLIIADLMKKFDSIPLRLEEDYHSIKDDILFFITDDIRATEEYKEYMKMFVGVTTALPIDDYSIQKKKRKQIVGETSSPRKSLKVTIKQKKPSTTPVPPPGDDQERDYMAEATLLSLTLYKTALAAEARENITKVQEKLEGEEIEKMVEGEDDEESSHKEHPENIDDDDDETEKEKKDDKKDDDKANNDEKKDETGSLGTRKKKMQTPISSPTRSPKKTLSSDKTLSQELTTTISPSTARTSKVKIRSNAKIKARSTSIKSKILPGSIAGICRRRGLIKIHLKSTFVTNEFFMGKIRKVLDYFNNVVLELTFANTNEMLKE
ncbi:hypothetical protein Tco_0270728 [Tanacetum coccineum]